MQTNYVLVSGELFANVRAWIRWKTTLTAATAHWVVFTLWCAGSAIWCVADFALWSGDAACRVSTQIRQIDFFPWTLQLNSSIVLLVRAPLSGGSVELMFVSSRVRCVANLLTSLFST